MKPLPFHPMAYSSISEYSRYGMRYKKTYLKSEQLSLSKHDLAINSLRVFSSMTIIYSGYRIVWRHNNA